MKGGSMRPPTPHEVACWEALHEHKGTVAAAAVVGTSAAGVRLGAEAYMRKMRLPGRLPYIEPRSYARSSDMARLREENARLVRELEAAREVIADLQALARPWVAVHAKLDRLLRAAPAAKPTHRRQADGGLGGKVERKALRVA